MTPKIPTRSEVLLDITTGEGVAVLKDYIREPDAALRELVPALGDLYASWQEANAEGAKLAKERHAIALRLGAMRKARNAATVYDEAEDAKLAAEVAQLDAALRRNEYVAKTKLADYLLATVQHGADGAFVPAAAEKALDAHARAVEALAALEAALDERERFYEVAGKPAARRHWSALEELSNYGGTAQARRNLRRTVERFPVDALEEAAK